MSDIEFEIEVSASEDEKNNDELSDIELEYKQYEQAEDLDNEYGDDEIPLLTFDEPNEDEDIPFEDPVQTRPCGPKPTKTNNAYTLNELRKLVIDRGLMDENDVKKLKMEDLCKTLNFQYTSSAQQNLFDNYANCLKKKKLDIVLENKEFLKTKNINEFNMGQVKKELLCDIIYKDKSPFVVPDDFKIENCYAYDFPTLKRIAVRNRIDTSRAKTQEDYCRLINLFYLRKNLELNSEQNPNWQDVPNEDYACLAPLSNELTLQEHQKKVVKHILTHRGLIAVHETGTGKTLTAVTAIHCMLAKYPNIRVLVITPLSLVDNFWKNFVKFGTDIKDPNFIARIDVKSYDEYANEQRRQKITDCSNTFLIVDEAHNLRTDYSINDTGISKGSLTYSVMLCASQAFKVLLLTATPVVNRSGDLKNLIMMVNGEHPLNKGNLAGFPKELLKKTVAQMDKETEEQVLVIDPDTKKVIEDTLLCKVSYFEAPQENFPTRIDIPLEETTIEMPDDYYLKYKFIERGGDSCSEQMSQYLAGDSLVENFYHGLRISINSLDGENSPKIDFIMDILEREAAAGRKTIVFSNWKKAGMNLLRKRLDAKNMKNLYAYVSGEVPKEIREYVKEKYNKNKIKILLITRAGGEGLDLMETRNVIIMESNWNPAIDQQIIGRAIRYKSHQYLPEEERNVKVYRIMLKKPKSIDMAQERFGRSIDEILYKMSYGNKQREIDLLKDIMKEVSIENQLCICDPSEQTSSTAGCQISLPRSYKKNKKVETKEEQLLDIEFDEEGQVDIPEKEVLIDIQFEEKSQPEGEATLLTIEQPAPILYSSDEDEMTEEQKLMTIPKKAFKDKKEEDEENIKLFRKHIYTAPEDKSSLGLSIKEIGKPMWIKLAGLSQKAKEIHGKRRGRKLDVLNIDMESEEIIKFKDFKNKTKNRNHGDRKKIEEVPEVIFEDELAPDAPDISFEDDQKDQDLLLEYKDETKVEHIYDIDPQVIPQNNDCRTDLKTEAQIMDELLDTSKNVEDDIQFESGEDIEFEEKIPLNDDIEFEEKAPLNDDIEFEDVEDIEFESGDDVDFETEPFPFMVMLAKVYEEKQDPTGWWHSEKLDGVRAIWDTKKLLTRNQKEIVIPDQFRKYLPKDTPLDGELFTKRQNFSKTSGIIRHKTPNLEDWKTIKFMIFDIPVKDIPFEKRLDKIQKIVNTQCRGDPKCPLVAVQNTKIKSREHLSKLHLDIVKKGAEGSMLRKPNSMYENKRSSSLLKLKPFEDLDAKVIGYQMGTGKYVGQLGSLIVTLVDDPSVKFNVGSGFEDQDRMNYKQLFPLNTIIRVQYNGFTEYGVPRFPVYTGIHLDRGLDIEEI